MSKLGESEDRGAWGAAIHGVTQSWTQFNDWTRTAVLSNVTLVFPLLDFFIETKTNGVCVCVCIVCVCVHVLYVIRNWLMHVGRLASPKISRVESASWRLRRQRCIAQWFQKSATSRADWHGSFLWPEDLRPRQSHCLSLSLSCKSVYVPVQR